MFQSAFFKAGYWQADYWQQVGGIATPEVTRPTGGWENRRYPEFRVQTDEERRKERERLGIIPREQKKLDRAAKAIAKRAGPDATAAEIERRVIEAREFDAVMGDLTARNRAVMDGWALMIAQAIQARVLQELQDEDDAIAMLLMEM